MKFLNTDTKTVIETTDKRRIAKLKGYPDKFKAIKDKKAPKTNTKPKTEKPEDKKDEKEQK